MEKEASRDGRFRTFGIRLPKSRVFRLPPWHSMYLLCIDVLHVTMIYNALIIIDSSTLATIHAYTPTSYTSK